MRTLLFATLALAFPLLVGGCRTTEPAAGGAPTAGQAPAPVVPPGLGRPFPIQRGVPAEIGDLTVVFTSVLEDSRCPQGTTCVWEGRATVNLTLDNAGREGGVNLTLSGATPTNGELPGVDALGYRFTLVSLDPYPGTEGATGAPSITLQVDYLTR